MQTNCQTDRQTDRQTVGQADSGRAEDAGGIKILFMDLVEFTMNGFLA